ncbi:MAG: YraN family protein [Patescibacteria group bacterium]|nr:YraN family protein [Patescibacteria group bacterium]
MKKFNVAKGKQGEAAAEEFLAKKGFELLERNHRTRYGEIDLVMKDREVVVFVEVKTKTGERFGEPWEMVDERKLVQIERLGKMWMVKNDFDGSCRIDVVGVWLDYGAIEKIEHWQNVEA